ncbi:MAG: serine acetyltransferase [Bacteroidetes bacterium]|jgi:serine O-acetyltransferase|nr:serine acetyltransferase [Bacteroidota bacterium]
MKDAPHITKLYQNYTSASKCVSLSTVTHFVDRLVQILFPVSIELVFIDEDDFRKHVLDLEKELLTILDCSLKSSPLRSKDIADQFFEYLPHIQATLDLDIDEIYQGDPAAQSREEVIRCYPGIHAIACYRIAHFFQKLEVPILPRMITECAHSKTGIDIHPAAEIESPFFIDHGTGIVIGATAVIGPHVKIYQGVTLGGLSVKKEDANVKRHPTIEEGVIIYAGATILGGDTVIGANCVIGGNTFITKSVDPGTTVYHSSKNKERKEPWS